MFRILYWSESTGKSEPAAHAICIPTLVSRVTRDKAQENKRIGLKKAERERGREREEGRGKREKREREREERREKREEKRERRREEKKKRREERRRGRRDQVQSHSRIT